VLHTTVCCLFVHGLIVLYHNGSTCTKSNPICMPLQYGPWIAEAAQ
jgi:hypothetical protein